MVYIMENPIEMDDLGGKNHPYFWFNTHLVYEKHRWFVLVFRPIHSQG